MHVAIRQAEVCNTLRRIYERRVDQLDRTMLVLLRNARVHEETVNNMRNFVATSLQCMYRGWKGREVACLARHRHMSAIQIQRVVRGNQYESIDMDEGGTKRRVVSRGRKRALRERRRQNMVLQSPWAMRQLLSRSLLIRTMGKWQEFLDPWTNEFYYFEMYTQDSQWHPPDEYTAFLACDWLECRFKANTMNEIHEHKRTQHTWYCEVCQGRNVGYTFPTCPTCTVVMNTPTIVPSQEWPLAIPKRQSVPHLFPPTATPQFSDKDSAPTTTKPPSRVGNVLSVGKQDGGSDGETGGDDPNSKASIVEARPRPCDMDGLDHVNWISAFKGMEEAFAKARFPSGSLYVGNFIHGTTFHGWGEYYYANGDRYRGQWHLGLRQVQSSQSMDSIEMNDRLFDEQGIGLWNSVCGKRYQGQWDQGRRHGIGLLQFPNGEVYQGEWCDGKIHGRGDLQSTSYECCGRGIFISAMGEKYIGDWKHNLKHGRGKYIFQNGDIFDGNFVSNHATGLGVYRFATTGDVYTVGRCTKASLSTGIFKAKVDSRTTTATGTFSASPYVVHDVCMSGRYTGSFVQAQKHGHGVFEWPNGNVYTGQFEWGTVNGVGTMVYSSGHKYDGEWRDERRHGRGTFWYANGDVFAGDWADDEFHGRGIFTWRPGSSMQEQYDGDWTHGIRHGQGRYAYLDGNVYDGAWNQGRRDGHGVYVWVNGEVYDGDFVQEEQHGHGKFTNQVGRPPFDCKLGMIEGDVYEGGWTHNIRTGDGEIRYADGSVFVGTFSNGLRHGQGSMTYPDGNTYRGMWLDDKRQGGGVYTFHATATETLRLKVFGY
ncbi:hypothetical protein DYB34_004214 [Aphanomyces astaci]|uniref:WW domain-containing protein n=1 Tax=Aphanomyces astaci TaxID=112090 RepID=A0A418BUW1_APHAT|nr:hypothetical protein DYB34_004214 [Aphanomyces astaci]